MVYYRWEAPRRRRGGHPEAPLQQRANRKPVAGPTAREITKRPPDFQFVILRDAVIVAIESWSSCPNRTRIGVGSTNLS